MQMACKASLAFAGSAVTSSRPGLTRTARRSQGPVVSYLRPLPLGLGLRRAPGSSRREGVMLKEAVSTSEVETVDTEVVENGNGKTNGNGNGATNGNGAKADSTEVIGTPIANAAAVAAAGTIISASTKAAAASVPAGKLANGVKKVNDATKPPKVLRTGDELMDPAEAGQMGLAAVAREADRDKKKNTNKTAETPYKNPGGRWNQFKSYGVFQRTCQIWSFAIKFAFKYVLLSKKFTYGKEGMTKEATSARKAELAIWLREGLVKLGPTFIKIGQQFSTRVDVLAPEFVKELEKLQDNVPPFDSETARATVEESLGAKLEDKFEYFETDPIAAASLGQVHMARINGQKVVVKVQRPGLKELFEIDCKNIRVLAEWLQRLDPKTDGAARDWVAIYDECQRILFEEIDYRKEGANAQRFKDNFAGTNWVKVPDVLWEYSSDKVLTLEYVPGVKINRREELLKAGMDVNQLARWNVESYLLQILKFGFFHADPHPGNVAVDTSYPGGRLIYYDFGMMGALEGDVRGGLVELFYGIYGRNVEQALKALITMGVLVPNSGDETSLKRTAGFFINAFGDRLKVQDQERKNLGSKYDDAYKAKRTKEESKERRKQILSNIGEDLLLAGQDQPFRFPAAFTFVIRSFTVLDGIGKSLTPKFDISEISAPYARSLLLEDNPILTKLREDFNRRSANQNRAVVNLFKGPNSIQYVSDTLSKMENGELKVRVRALEAERALVRVEAGQKVMTNAVVASMMVNVGTVLSVSAMSAASTAAFVVAGAFGFVTLTSYLKVAKLKKQELRLKGQF